MKIQWQDICRCYFNRLYCQDPGMFSLVPPVWRYRAMNTMRVPRQAPNANREKNDCSNLIGYLSVLKLSESITITHSAMTSWNSIQFRVVANDVQCVFWALSGTVKHLLHKDINQNYGVTWRDSSCASSSWLAIKRPARSLFLLWCHRIKSEAENTFGSQPKAPDHPLAKWTESAKDNKR